MNLKNFILNNIHNDNAIDQRLNIQYDVIEDGLERNLPEYLYTDYKLNSHALNTNYSDFLAIFKLYSSRRPAKWVDLGCAQGKMGIIAHYFFKSFSYTGIDLVCKRFQKAKEITASNKKIKFLKGNLLSLTLPKADYYFIYLPHGEVLESVLKGLYQQAKKSSFKIIVVESHGEVIPLLETLPWLKKEPIELKLNSKRQNPKAYTFSPIRKELLKRYKAPKTILKDELTFHYARLNFLEYDIFIKNPKEEYTISAREMTPIIRKGKVLELETKYPRTILKEEDFTIKKRNYDHYLLSKLATLRAKNQRINFFDQTNQKFIKNVFVRKLFISPKVLLETSEGYRYELSKVKLV